MSYKETPEPGQAPKGTPESKETCKDSEHLSTVETLLETIRNNDEHILWSIDIKIDPDV